MGYPAVEAVEDVPLEFKVKEGARAPVEYPTSLQSSVYTSSLQMGDKIPHPIHDP